MIGRLLKPFSSPASLKAKGNGSLARGALLAAPGLLTNRLSRLRDRRDTRARHRGTVVPRSPLPSEFEQDLKFTLAALAHQKTIATACKNIADQLLSLSKK